MLQQHVRGNMLKPVYELRFEKRKHNMLHAAAHCSMFERIVIGSLVPWHPHTMPIPVVSLTLRERDRELLLTVGKLRRYVPLTFTLTLTFSSLRDFVRDSSELRRTRLCRANST